MGDSPFKPFVSRPSPDLYEACSPPPASVTAKEPRDGASGSAQVLADTPPSEAVGPLRKRLRSALPEHGWGAKRLKDVGSVIVPHTAQLLDDGQSPLASAETESLLFSLGARSDLVLVPSKSAHGVQPMSPFQLDATKHKIFFSHSGAQKDFVEQLCVDLERLGYIFPFFDQRHHSLPHGEDFAPLIIKAAQLCHVAVIVLSEEYLCSKWPMLELAEFYAAQQIARGGRRKLTLLPLFFKLSAQEVMDYDRWIPSWEEHAQVDGRIDLSKWIAAVKALCKTNGLVFGKVARTEVSYRKCVVESLFKLSPPDLLFGSSQNMVGYGRMCEVMSRHFVEDPVLGIQVLGLYGMAGLGKTTLAKALCDYFHAEFFGKVCHVDMGKGSRARRQMWMLKTLCDFETDSLECIGTDVVKGLTQLKLHLKRAPVFLVIDNVTNNAHLLKEVEDYFMMEFHPNSRIMITAAGKRILEDLLPNMESYIQMPRLTSEEAGVLFLKHGAPMKSVCELTPVEQKILASCIKKCWFDSEGGGSYHPVALTALADFFSRVGRHKENQILSWKDHLGEDMNRVKDVWKSSKDLFDILGLQFSTFSLNEKLLFLDVALYTKHCFSLMYGGGYNWDSAVGWLSRVHEERPRIMRRKLFALERSGLINCLTELGKDIFVPTLYKKFARWYATEHKVTGVKNAWGVFQTTGASLRGDSSTPIKRWSDLLRLRIFNMGPANARLVASKTMQELSNLVILQLFDCSNTEKVDLQGLHCLRDLELVRLKKLTTIVLPGMDEYARMYDTLQHVLFEDLIALLHMPDFRPFYSLHSIFVKGCEEVSNFEKVGCASLEDLWLLGLTAHQVLSIPDVLSLPALVHFSFEACEYGGGIWENGSGRWSKTKGSWEVKEFFWEAKWERGNGRWSEKICSWDLREFFREGDWGKDIFREGDWEVEEILREGTVWLIFEFLENLII